ncbi:hypothetical protein [Pseudoalteromonas prydzensis]|uniref:hypothetical protein n=1 Tax=Pseudoalteromonas prydzensis TaxID=182141 RepID=UPI0007E4EA32|nr:hypothetical protein [Pseudoalteromonas prydzensis]MBE0380664.1 hypothetical protein [Pseudoalteromonas prydzensis ACAM 620]
MTITSNYLAIQPTRTNENEDSKNRLKVAKTGLKFDPETDVWKLKHGVSPVKVGWLSSLKDNTLAAELREGLASAARKLTVSRITPASKAWSEYLSRSNEEVTKSSLIAYVAYVHKTQSADVKLSVISGTLKYLLPLNRSRYKPLVDHFKTVTFRSGNRNDFLNPETGALSSTEDGNLVNGLRQHYQGLLQATSNSDDSGLTYAAWSGYFGVRLLHFTNRRFDTLSQMKWKDFINIHTQGIELIRHEARFPRAKTQDGGFRKQWEGYRIELNEELVGELNMFRSVTERCILRMLRENEIKLSESDLVILSKEWPLLCQPNAFPGCYQSMELLKWPDQMSLFTAAKGPGLHMTSNTFSSQTRKVLKAMDIKSERVSDFSYGARRQRHTLGTSMAIEGHEDAVIAKALGVIDKSTVKAYKDMTPGAIDTIDRIMSPVLGPLVDVAMGRVIINRDEADAQVTTDGIDAIGACKHCQQQCKSKELSAPFACYPCDLFRPIASGEHSKVLNEAVQHYKREVKRGARPFQLRGWSRVIRYIQLTIIACHKFNQEQSDV